jgi:protein-disulfide isomerase
LSPIRFLVCCALIALAAGCRAQVPPNAAANRRIEVLVRSQFNVPSDYDVILGGKTKSDISGYDNLPITFSHNGKQTTVPFLISTDGNTLARLEKFDISRDPQDALSIARRPIRGNPAAKVTIVNFDDLECPYCARMHEELFPGTLDRYQGQVRFVYKDFPLVEIHPWAMHAAVDANCLAEQSGPAYWTFVDYVHSHGHEISGGGQDPAKAFLTLDQTAQDLGKREHVDDVKLNACLQKQDESTVRASMREGEKLGIEGTPQVFVEGERLTAGAVSTEMVWDAIDRALRAVGERPPPRPEPTPVKDAAPTAPATQGGPAAPAAPATQGAPAAQNR